MCHMAEEFLRAFPDSPPCAAGYLLLLLLSKRLLYPFANNKYIFSVCCVGRKRIEHIYNTFNKTSIHASNVVVDAYRMRCNRSNPMRSGTNSKSINTLYLLISVRFIAVSLRCRFSLPTGWGAS